MGAHKVNGGLDFRDLECFNKALLAKQLCCFLTQLQSLAAIILREKYCKIENEMTIIAKRHNSLLWKSLLVALEIIEGDSHWKVGNGEKIKIWADRWLPSQGTFQVQSLIKMLLRSATIKELLKDTCSKWNEDIIKAIF